MERSGSDRPRPSRRIADRIGPQGAQPRAALTRGRRCRTGWGPAESARRTICASGRRGGCGRRCARSPRLRRRPHRCSRSRALRTEGARRRRLPASSGQEQSSSPAARPHIATRWFDFDRGLTPRLLGSSVPTLSPVSAIGVNPMKTTIELPDDLLERSKTVARREGSTLKALIEEGLHLALRARGRRQRGEPFRIRPLVCGSRLLEVCGAGGPQSAARVSGDRSREPAARADKWHPASGRRWAAVRLRLLACVDRSVL